MLRIIAIGGLVCLCAVPGSALPARTHPGHLILAAGSLGQEGVPSRRADRLSAADFGNQQNLASRQINAAKRQLEDDLSQLLRLKEIHPDDKELDKAIARLRGLSSSFQTSGITATETDPARLAAQTRMLNQVAVDARRKAAEGHDIASQVLARLGRPGTPPSTRGNGSGEAPKPPQPFPDPSPISGALPPPPPPPPIVQPVQTPTGSDPSPATVPPSQPPAAPGSPDSSTPGQSSRPPDDGETAWFARLTRGLLQYHVPEVMLWKVPSTVTVRINGENSSSIETMGGQTGQATIKVARRMKVLVTAPDNPDEFVIAPESGTTPEQYVPEDGPTTWRYSVTPRFTARQQKLVVQAWVLYDGNTQRELPVYTGVVNVHVPSFRECVKRLFQGDPDYWIKYGLPGGAGFVFLSGVVTGIVRWIRNRKKKAVPSVPAHS